MNTVSDPFSIQGKKALVICPENPYGKELAEGLLFGGAHVYLAGDPEKMPALSASGTFSYRHGSAEDAARLADWVRSEMGTLDILVENGMHSDLSGWEPSYAQILGALEESHLGTMLTVQSLGHIFAEQGHGSVILVSDYGALVGYDPQNYIGSPALQNRDFSLVKGFIQGGNVNYARQCSNFLAEHGCRCNTLALGPLEGSVDSAFADRFVRHSQVKRLLKPQDITSAVIFLGSDASSFITGITLPVDGGYTAK